LRDRREDIPALVDHFMRMYAGRLNRRVEPVSPSALKALTDYDWPGNVRELANVVDCASITAQDGDLRFDLPLGGDRSESAGRGAVSVASSPGEILSEAAMRQQERENIAAALRRTRGKIYGEDGAARLLGIKPTALLIATGQLRLKPTRHVPLVSARLAQEASGSPASERRLRETFLAAAGRRDHRFRPENSRHVPLDLRAKA
jgi:DNA-binding NtrC family response regulator